MTIFTIIIIIIIIITTARLVIFARCLLASCSPLLVPTACAILPRLRTTHTRHLVLLVRRGSHTFIVIAMLRGPVVDHLARPHHTPRCQVRRNLFDIVVLRLVLFRLGELEIAQTPLARWRTSLLVWRLLLMWPLCSFLPALGRCLCLHVRFSRRRGSLLCRCC